MPKTNKERLQDNNTALLRIKGKAENLPDKLVNIVDGEVSGTTLILNSKPYIELEYIESTGTQYIDMNIQPSSSFGIDMILQYTEVASPTAYFNTFGCNNGTNAIFLRQNDYGNTTVRFGTFNVSAGTLLQDTNKHTMSLRSTTMYIDTNLYNLSANTFIINKNMYLFAFNNNDRVEIERLPKMKLYYTKIYDGFILVRDFIPVKRKSDNEICMYDKVTNTFFTNVGTGSFIAGPEIS